MRLAGNAVKPNKAVASAFGAHHRRGRQKMTREASDFLDLGDISDLEGASYAPYVTVILLVRHVRSHLAICAPRTALPD